MTLPADNTKPEPGTGQNDERSRERFHTVLISDHKARRWTFVVEAAEPELRAYLTQLATNGTIESYLIASASNVCESVSAFSQELVRLGIA